MLCIVVQYCIFPYPAVYGAEPKGPFCGREDLDALQNIARRSERRSIAVALETPRLDNYFPPYRRNFPKENEVRIKFPDYPDQYIHGYFDPFTGTLSIEYRLTKDSVLFDPEILELAIQPFADRVQQVRLFMDRRGELERLRIIEEALREAGQSVGRANRYTRLSDDQRAIVLAYMRRSLGGRVAARFGLDNITLQSAPLRDDGAFYNVSVILDNPQRLDLSRNDPNKFHVVDRRDPDAYKIDAKIRDDGTVSAVIETKKTIDEETGRIIPEERGALRGRAEFDRMMAKFQGRMRKFHAVWHFGDNIEFIQNEIRRRVGRQRLYRRDYQLYLPELAKQTWTGRQLDRHGYTEVKIDWDKMAWDSDDGSYEYFSIQFTKPESQ